jgi:transcriptional regulator with XRE-family HTH domain
VSERSLDPATELIRHLIGRERALGETYQAIADRLKTSKAHVINIHQHGDGAGLQTQMKVAAAFYDGSIDKFRKAAEADAGSPLKDPDLERALEVAQELLNAAGPLVNGDDIDPLRLASLLLIAASQLRALVKRVESK